MIRSTLYKTAKHLKFFFFLAIFFISQSIVSGQCGDLYIAGVIDGPLAGGQPKALQLCASAAIPDLSLYGFESVTNGNASGGAPEFVLPADPLAAGDCIWIANDFATFNAFFGFDACFESNDIGVNGDDPILLYCSGAVVDAFGTVGTDGTGECWEYLDGWAVSATGMQNGGTFSCANYTFSGINVLDGEADNATSATPYPSPASNCPTQTCAITNVTVMTQGFCSGDDAMYTICADVVGGSGAYVILDMAGTVLGSASGGAAGNICITATVAGPTTVGTIDVDFFDGADNTCAGGTFVTVNIPACPQVNNCPMAFISEYAYDCDVDDANEMIEVCVPDAFTGNLSDLAIELYNGNGNVVYQTLDLGVDFTAGTSDGTNTYYVFTPASGGFIQQGPDAIALSFQGVNCEFISYEGVLTAADGSATGMSSTDVGVGQNNSTTCDMTLQLCNGVWEAGTSSPGSANACPTGMCPDLSISPPTVGITDSTCPAGDTAPSGGSIIPTACPAGSTAEYSTDGGANWSAAIPTYDQAGPVQMITARCVCTMDPTMVSPPSGTASTSPGTCTVAGCDAFITTFPANGN